MISEPGSEKVCPALTSVAQEAIMNLPIYYNRLESGEFEEAFKII